MPLNDVLQSVTANRFSSSQVLAAPPEFGAPAPLSPYEQLHSVARLVTIDLTESETAEVSEWQQSRLVLGSAISVVMMCDLMCPRLGMCPLARAHKAPFGYKCPLELHQATERFSGWCDELGVNPMALAESERAAVSELVRIDIQIQRCLDILAQGEATKLTDRSVTDVDTNGVPICFETVIHQNEQLLDTLQSQRSRILKEWELTPEMRSKKNKGVLKAVADLATRTTENADRLRAVRKNPQILTINPTNC